MLQTSPRLVSTLRTIERPTLVVAAAIYGSFAGLTLLHTALPWPVILCLGGYLVAWHGSLQHEVAHGHPTPWPCLNEALVFPSMWLPFRCYRRDHHVHHMDRHLTDPSRDPESWYVPMQTWQQMGRALRACRAIADTSAGRLLIAPWWVVTDYAKATPKNAVRRPPRPIRVDPAPRWRGLCAGLGHRGVRHPSCRVPIVIRLPRNRPDPVTQLRRTPSASRCPASHLRSRSPPASCAALFE